MAAYLGGGLVPAGPNTSMRVFAGGSVAGNTVAWDNIAVMPGWISGLPPGPMPCTIGPCCYPVGSLRTSGYPRIASTFSYLVDLPANGTSLFSFVALAHSFTAIVPCGMPLPGITNQNVMIGLPAAVVSMSGPWTGPGNPITFTLAIPASSSIVGVALHSQGVFMNPPPFVMTEAVTVVVGG
jgi:hypothetical protein